MRDILIVFVLLFATSCSEELDSAEYNNNLDFDTEITLNPGTSISNTSLTIYCDSVTDDNRCPTNCNCTWSGTATVDFIVSISGEDYEMTLYTYGDSIFPNCDTIGQYKITLTQVSPYPETDTIYTQHDYEATIIVSEILD